MLFDSKPKKLEAISINSKSRSSEHARDAKRFKMRLFEHTRQYSSILNRFDEHHNIHKKRGEIPHFAGIHSLIFLNIDE